MRIYFLRDRLSAYFIHFIKKIKDKLFFMLFKSDAVNLFSLGYKFKGNF